MRWRVSIAEVAVGLCKFVLQDGGRSRTDSRRQGLSWSHRAKFFEQELIYWRMRHKCFSLQQDTYSLHLECTCIIVRTCTGCAYFVLLQVTTVVRSTTSHHVVASASDLSLRQKKWGYVDQSAHVFSDFAISKSNNIDVRNVRRIPLNFLWNWMRTKSILLAADHKFNICAFY